MLHLHYLPLSNAGMIHGLVWIQEHAGGLDIITGYMGKQEIGRTQYHKEFWLYEAGKNKEYIIITV